MFLNFCGNLLNPATVPYRCLYIEHVFFLFVYFSLLSFSTISLVVWLGSIVTDILDIYMNYNIGLDARKPVFGVLDQFIPNQPAQLQRLPRNLKFSW